EFVNPPPQHGHLKAVPAYEENRALNLPRDERKYVEELDHALARLQGAGHEQKAGRGLPVWQRHFGSAKRFSPVSRHRGRAKPLDLHAAEYDLVIVRPAYARGKTFRPHAFADVDE